MAASLPVYANQQYWIRTFVSSDWAVTDYGGHPTQMRIVSPAEMAGVYALPDPGWWPGTGLIALPRPTADGNLVLEMTAGNGWTVLSTEPHVNNAGSGTTPPPPPYQEDGVADGLPFLRASWEMTAIPDGRNEGGSYDNNDAWTYLFSALASGWKIGEVGIG